MTEPAACSHDPEAGSSSESTLDIDHLNRMTLGDRALEREVLQLFDQHTAMLSERLQCASASVAASCAHTLKGAARGIGAWRLAHAAAQVERAVAAGGPEAQVVAQLLHAVDETRNAIVRHLGPT